MGESCCSAPLGAWTRGAAGGCQQHPLHEVILSISTGTAAGFVPAGAACCPGSGAACCLGSPCSHTAAGPDTAAAEERGRSRDGNRTMAPAAPAQPKPAVKPLSESSCAEGSNSQGKSRAARGPELLPHLLDPQIPGERGICRGRVARLPPWCRPSASATGACCRQGHGGLALLRPSLCSQQPQHKQSKNIALRSKRGTWLPQMKRMSSVCIPQQSCVRELGKVSPLQTHKFC